jgi:hypothetical protein
VLIVLRLIGGGVAAGLFGAILLYTAWQMLQRGLS